MAKTVAVVGASTSRAKFGNKALRAFLAEGYRVLPINPNESEVEGLKTYASVLDVPGPIDMATVYVQPDVTLRLLDEFAQARSLERLRLVKVDVERAEEHLLCGAEKLLSDGRIDYLIVELNSNTEAERILERHGYTGYLLDEPQRRLRPLANVPAGTFCDVLFVSPQLRDGFARQFSQSIEPTVARS